MFESGDRVKKITDGKVGIVKSIIKTSNATRYQIQFDNGEALYLSEDILEKYQKINTPLEAFSNFQFSGIDDYKRTMAFQRLLGISTSLYSRTSLGLGGYFFSFSACFALERFALI